MEVKDYFADYSSFIDAVTSDTAKNDALFQTHLKDLSNKLHGNYGRLDHAVTGLTGEAGEVADVWKKIKFMGLEYNEESRQKMIKELGDVCWYLFSIATALNVPVEQIINTNIEKLKARHPHGYSAQYMENKRDD
ncbi:MAG: nucleoside triphosphate pyrophosphohydrolase family protein [Alphaproteobacteria bacterium]|nr:nucleoside triphosphate pyrophosphohydrolase family protein [Alphaproteobacteria bacterium]